MRRYALDQRVAMPRAYAGRVGRKYGDAIAMFVASAAAGTECGLRHDYFDVRHPYLHRPLVEFALGLPPELCVRPHTRKWLLREAMHGILPDLVRTRVGKGILLAPIASSLIEHRDLLEWLTRRPVLADLGIVPAEAVRTAFNAALTAPETRERLAGAVHLTLTIEAWLQTRSGRWPAEANIAVRHQQSPALTPRAEWRKE